MLASMINAYASLFKSGITGLQIINTLFDVNGNIMDYIGKDLDSEGKYSFYCVNLWNFSYGLANSMDAMAKDFIDNQILGDNSRVFLQPNEKKYDIIYGNFRVDEFQNMISSSIYSSNTMSKYNIRGLVKYTDRMKINTFQSGHYVFSMNNQIVDSLNPNRKQAKNYIPNSFFNLSLEKRY